VRHLVGMQLVSKQLRYQLREVEDSSPRQKLWIHRRLVKRYEL
jgi:hypothetical protein